MRFSINELYSQDIISGPYERSFSNVVVGKDKADSASLFIHAEGTYMENTDNMLRAYQQGCRIFMASSVPNEIVQDDNTTIINTPNPLQEFERIVSLIRSATPAQIIGITGSSGKTTTKDMTAHILRAKFKKTLKTYRNYNGALGVCLTLRKLEHDDEFAVVEIGLGDSGSVDKGASLARPHHGIITNIGVSHIAKFGSIKNIAREKGALLAHIAPGGTAILNGDDPWCCQLAIKCQCNLLFFGRKRGNTLAARDIVQVNIDKLKFDVVLGSTKQTFLLNATGDFQVYNALAAIAVGHLYGYSLSEMADRFLAFSPGDQRLKAIKFKRFYLLDDGYNSNPRALAASLQALQGLPLNEGKKVAVIGDMQDLGRFNQMYYKQLSTQLKSLAFDHVVLIGPNVSQLAHELPSVSVATNAVQAAEQALTAVGPNGVLLLKGQDDRLFTLVRSEIEKMEGEAP